MRQTKIQLPRQGDLPAGKSLPEATDLQASRQLWHYQPDFGSRPDRCEYHTGDPTDPACVVLDIQFLSSSADHAVHLAHCARRIGLLARDRMGMSPGAGQHRDMGGLFVTESLLQLPGPTRMANGYRSTRVNQDPA